MATIQLGNKVKCKVTGLTGIATARCEYLNGCVQFCIKPPIGKDGKEIDGTYVDQTQIEVVGKGVSIKPSNTGGPMRDTPRG